MTAPRARHTCENPNVRRLQFLDPPQTRAPVSQAAPTTPLQLAVVSLVVLSMGAITGVVAWRGFLLPDGVPGALEAKAQFAGLAWSILCFALAAFGVSGRLARTGRSRVAAHWGISGALVVYGVVSTIAFMAGAPPRTWWAAPFPVAALVLSIYPSAMALNGIYGFRRGTHDADGYPLDRPGYRKPPTPAVTPRRLPVPVHPNVRKLAAVPAGIACLFYVLLWAFTAAEGPDLTYGPGILLLLSVISAVINVGVGALAEVERDSSRKLTWGLLTFPILCCLMGIGLSFGIWHEESGVARAIAVVPLVWLGATMALHRFAARTRAEAYADIVRELKSGRSAII